MTAPQQAWREAGTRHAETALRPTATAIRARPASPAAPNGLRTPLRDRSPRFDADAHRLYTHYGPV